MHFLLVRDLLGIHVIKLYICIKNDLEKLCSQYSYLFVWEFLGCYNNTITIVLQQEWVSGDGIWSRRRGRMRERERWGLSQNAVTKTTDRP